MKVPEGFETLDVSLDAGVLQVELARPERVKATDPDVRAVLFTGRGRAFCAGADITELAAYESVNEPLDHISLLQRAYNTLEELEKPTIAAIHGFAYGGGLELALCCDFRVVARDAKLGVPEIQLGLLPGAGGTQRLSHSLPLAVAKRMILLGEALGAEEALAHGLVTRVVAPEHVRDESLALARTLCALPPLALRVGKLLIHGAAHPTLRTGIEAERQGMAFLFATEDRKEGTRAFLQKRKPQFLGR
jgi:enoyl-CoA hydratase/carnithine racemase